MIKFKIVMKFVTHSSAIIVKVITFCKSFHAIASMTLSRLHVFIQCHDLVNPPLDVLIAFMTIL